MKQINFLKTAIWAVVLAYGIPLFYDGIDLDKAAYHINQVPKKSITLKINKGESKRKYAVLIGGTNKKHTLENITTAYDTLMQAGYTDETILVYVPDKELLKERKDIVDYAMEGTKIEEGLQSLAGKITKEDEFFFLYSGHANEKEIGTSNDRIDGDKLESLILPIKAGQTIMVFDACHAGAFSERFGKGNTIAISTSKKNKTSSFLSKFTRYLFSALESNEGDTNRDGKTSLKEAFVYAAENDPAQNRTRWSCWSSKIFRFRQVPNLQYENINPKEVYFEKE